MATDRSAMICLRGSHRFDADEQTPEQTEEGHGVGGREGGSGALWGSNGRKMVYTVAAAVRTAAVVSPDNEGVIWSAPSRPTTTDNSIRRRS